MNFINKYRFQLKIVLFSLLLAILLVLDIITKYTAFNNLSQYEAVTAIPYLFNFTLVFNKGAGWGMFEDQKWFLCTVSAVLGTAILGFLIYRFKKLRLPVIIALVLMVAGAYGNLIDRIGYAASLGIYKEGVVDFLQFAFWTSFPVFNLADSYLVIGIFILIIYAIVLFINEHFYNKNKVKSEPELSDEDLAKRITEKKDEINHE